MTIMKKILVLTADTGFGHRSTANAIAEALQEKYGTLCEVIISNPMEDKRIPFFLRESESDYDRLVRDMPDLYRLGYNASDSPIPSAIVESALTVIFFEVMRDLVKDYRPDAIITTHPFYQSALGAVFDIHRNHILFFTTITDLATVHQIWFSPAADRLLVPNQTIYNLAVSNGIKPEKIFITGIPISPKFACEKRSRQEIRLDLGWDAEALTILAVGSRRVENLLETLNVINHFGKPLQIAFAAGKDDILYQKAQEMEWHMPVHLYDYVSNMSSMMHASDILICKAGGLIITEALACQLPMILIDIIPGQETGNARFVVDNNVGDLAQTPVELLEVMTHLTMEDGQLLKIRANNAARLSRPFAAFETADLLWEAADKGLPKTGKLHSSKEHLKLVDLLNKFQIQLQGSPIYPPKKHG
jgi:1,2-diacylglycerol 3-beta-galactosyltransferase